MGHGDLYVQLTSEAGSLPQMNMERTYPELEELLQPCFENLDDLSLYLQQKSVKPTMEASDMGLQPTSDQTSRDPGAEFWPRGQNLPGDSNG